MPWQANVVGLLTLALGVAVAVWRVPGLGDGPFGVYLGVIWVLVAWFVWHHPQAPRTVKGWFGISAAFLLFCGLMALLDQWLAPPNSGWLVIDAWMALTSALVGLSGAARSLAICWWKKPQKKD